MSIDHPNYISPPGPFPVPMLPMTGITPFTYRDGYTYLNALEELRRSVNKTMESVGVQNQAVDEFRHYLNLFLEDLMGKLVGYTIEIGEHTYQASMMDGSVFEAYTITGVDSEIGELSDSVSATISEIRTAVDNFIAETTSKVEEFRDEVGTDITQLQADVNSQLTTFRNSVNDDLDSFQDGVNAQIQGVTTALNNHVSQTTTALAHERILSEQTDMVSVMANRSNYGRIELRVSGTADYPSFSVYRVYEGREAVSGQYVETTFAGTSVENDDYYRIAETHVGSAEKTSTPGSYTYTRAHTITPYSNHEFALRIRPASMPSATSQWVPYHNGIPTAVHAEDPVFMTKNGRLRIIEGDDDRVQIDGDLELAQHIYGRHPSSGTQNLIEVWTSHVFKPDGSIHVSGRWKALVDIVVDSGYVLMLPTNPTYVSRFVDGLGNAYASSVGKYGTEDTLPDGNYSVAAVTTGLNNVAFGVTYDNPRETLRIGKPGKPASAGFIEHRDASIAKVYQQLFESGTTVPAGSVHRFAGRYSYAYSPWINHSIDVI